MEHTENRNPSIEDLFAQIIRLHFSRTHAALEKLGLYPGQPPLLMALKNYGIMSQKELSQKLCVKPATVAVMLKRMEKTGLIDKKIDLKDKRIFRVYLTKQGEEMINVLLDIYSRLEADCLLNFTVEEKVLLRRLLMQVRDNLSHSSEECSYPHLYQLTKEE